MKDVDRFISDLNAPPRGAPVTEQDLDEDAKSFLAFASALGIAPPVAGGRGPGGVPLPTSTPEAVEG